jgi:carboxyl-terminal processing protease
MRARFAWAALLMMACLSFGRAPAFAAEAKPTADPKADLVKSGERSDKDEDEYYDLYKALADTVDQVDRNYVKKVSRRELMEAAIKGVLTKLDPYSSYIGPEDAEKFKDSVEAQFGGIGIQITMDEGQLTVLSPLFGTPAYKAGLLAGDRIIKIGSDATDNLTLDEAVGKLKGEPGTSVSLTVVHQGTSKPTTVNVAREVIHVDTVLGDRRKGDDTWDFMLEPEKRIGYIRITSFSRDTAGDLKKAMDSLKAHKLRGLILDLRFNPGGLLTSAIETCDMFLTEGRIVSTEGRNTPKRVWDATKKTDAYTGFPMVILVNRYSASASEIVSACLQDHNRAVIVGERTWGKGSVQNVIELEDGKSLLKLTTASYQRPNGHNIHRFPDSKETDEWGVSPNKGFEVRMTDGEMVQWMAERRVHDILLGKKAGDKTAAIAGDPNARHPEAHPLPRDVADSKRSDRQMQKALDYLSTELARAK